jgi:hypothetical protein
MKVRFDDEAWQRLQDDLGAGQVWAETAGKLYALAKGAVQQASAALVGERNASPEESAHALEMVKTLRAAARDAARRFSAAAAYMDELTRQLKPEPGGKRRRAGAAANSA